VIPVRRSGVGLALAWYLALGFGVPLLDAALFHDPNAPRGAHIESSESDCHRGECSFDAPGAPQSPAGAPVGITRLEALRFTAGAQLVRLAPLDRRPPRANGPRAPPRHT